jgi:16S rRNA (cytidine1402-2'-O)-methyltransferase
VPTLYVVPTPVGNLEDITLRALRVLRTVDLVLAEDTRHTRKLLAHYSISVPLRSYHQYNKSAALDGVLHVLQSGDVALVSDAGTPSIADPGFELIGAAHEAGIAVDVLPGPSAAVTAVVAAALPAPGFLFVGFLPRKRTDRRGLLERTARLPYTLVAFESPHRLLDTLLDLDQLVPTRPVVVARELTKVHQELARGTAGELRLRFGDDPPRGEITLLVAGTSDRVTSSQEDAWEEMVRLSRSGVGRAAALRTVTEECGLPRNEAYRMWLRAQDGESDGSSG